MIGRGGISIQYMTQFLRMFLANYLYWIVKKKYGIPAVVHANAGLSQRAPLGVSLVNWWLPRLASLLLHRRGVPQTSGFHLRIETVNSDSVSSSCSGSPKQAMLWDFCGLQHLQFQGISDDPGHGWAYFSIAIPSTLCQHSTTHQLGVPGSVLVLDPLLRALLVSAFPRFKPRSAVSDAGSLVYPYSPIILKTD